MLWILRSLPLAALLASAAAGQDAGIKQSLERFKLFNACRPMELVVEGLRDGAADIGLAKGALQAAAESRLRAARLYTGRTPAPRDDRTAPVLADFEGEKALEKWIAEYRKWEAENPPYDAPYLYVNVNVSGPAFSVSVGYHRNVSNAFGHDGIAMTWNAGSTGTHGRDAGYIVSSLSQHLDSFLAAYLRVNEQACGPPAP